MTTSSKSKKRYHLDNPIEFLNSLGISRRCGNGLSSNCTIHGGDAPSALTVYINDGEIKWRCFTHHCEKQYGDDIIGLIKGILKCSHQDAVSKIRGSELSDEEIKRLSFASQIRHVRPTYGIPKKLVRRRLNIPAKYFIDRGYSSSILNTYDVGFSEKLQRVVVPIYESTGQNMIGFTARTTVPKCKACHTYHNGCCLDKKLAKWITKKNFSIHSCLYNFWNARSHILKDKYVILVEGPGDVWRLEENNERHSLGLFGTSLTDEQLIVLEKSGARTIFLALDNDKAGAKGAASIESQCRRIFNVFKLKYYAKDIGELNQHQVAELQQCIRSHL